MIQKIKISDFAQVITGGTPSTKNNDYWENGIIPWLNSGELNQEIITTTRNYITESGLKNSSARMMPPNSVLIALTGATAGVVGYLTFNACANQSVTGILPSEKHEPKYLFYYLKSIRPKVLNDAYGGGQPHISQAYVKDLQIPLPPLETQKRIAQILDDAQALKQKTELLLKEYDDLAQSIFLDMFGDTWTNPFGIKQMKLSEITHNDKIITYGIVQAGEEVEGGVPYIRTGDLKKGKILVNQLKRTSHEIAKSYERSKCLTGDIIMSIRATVGTIAILPEELNGCNLTQGTARISADPKIMNNTYLFHCIDSKGVQLKIDKDTKGATFKEITLGRLRNIEIPVPNIGLQNQFAEKITLIEQQKELAKQELKESEDLFNCLIQKAFKGELV